MYLEQTLTQENFFNEMMQLYPKAVNAFLKWMDNYKVAVGWNNLFGEKVKYHQLPYAMQYGIWIEYCRQELHTYFEQPEHICETVDLREDITGVFKETETLIDSDE